MQYLEIYLIVDSRAHECKIESESELCASAPVVARAVLCHPRDEKRRRHSFVSNREKSQPACICCSRRHRHLDYIHRTPPRIQQPSRRINQPTNGQSTESIFLDTNLPLLLLLLLRSACTRGCMLLYTVKSICSILERRLYRLSPLRKPRRGRRLG